MAATEELVAPAPAVTEPETVRALMHPVRQSLLEVLGLEGPLTATEASTLVGESATTCSFHFRQLAKYGFVEEDGRGPGRQRRWRLTRLLIDVAGRDGGAEDTAAAALSAMLQERALQRVRHSIASTSHGDSATSFFRQVVAHLTPEEFDELDRRLVELLAPYAERESHVVPGARAVEVVCLGRALGQRPGATPRRG